MSVKEAVITANGVPVFERDGGAGPVVVGPFEFTSKVCGISVDQFLLAVKFSTQQAVNWLLIGTDPVGW